MKKDSIDLLKKIVESIELKFNECYVTNLMKCEIEDLSIKPSQVMNNCSYILKREIEEMNPKIVLVFGELLPLQKIIKESKGIQWFNVEHPITLIKNPELKRVAWNTLKMVKERLS